MSAKPGLQQTSAKTETSAVGSGHPSEDSLAAVYEAEPSVLAAALAHLTGNQDWVRDPRAHGLIDQQRPASADRKLTADHQAYLRDAAGAVEKLIASGESDLPIASDIFLLETARAVMGPHLTSSDIAKLRHHLEPNSQLHEFDPGKVAAANLRIVLIGAGMSGIGLAFQLEKAGFDYTILEKNEGAGGVWLDNVYPDCGVDTQAFQYMYDLLPNLDWTRYDVRRDELLGYIDQAVQETGIGRKIKYSSEVTRAEYDATTAEWRLSGTNSDGEFTMTADVVISAVGSLNRPKIPAFPGLDTFAGFAFHTARWNPDIDLTGKRVALVGSGSSGTQVGRVIAEKASHMVSFQRTPHWVRQRTAAETGPVGDGKRMLLEKLPGYFGWYRFFLDYAMGDRDHHRMVREQTPKGLVPSAENERVRHDLITYLESQLEGRPDLIEKLTPRYSPYGKRLVCDNGFLAAMRRDNVTLVTGGIERIVPEGIIAEDGTLYEVDGIVFATGFHGTRYFWPLEIIGRSGTPLAEAHGGDDNLRAYLGVVMPDCPNFFTLQGPNSSIGHGGGTTFISECQGRFIMAALNEMVDHDLRAIEIREDVCHEYNDTIDSLLSRMVWAEEGLESRFRNHSGRIMTNHPWTLRQFWERSRLFDLADFITTPRDTKGDQTVLRRVDTSHFATQH